MISSEELTEQSRARIRQARILKRNREYDGAIYLCGYAVEHALKAIVCKGLGGDKKSWSHFPSTIEEFKIIAAMKTHNLDELLQQTPVHINSPIRIKYMAEWSTVLKWSPDLRYAPIKRQGVRIESEEAIKASAKILRFLWKELK